MMMTVISGTAKTKAQFDIYLLMASTFNPIGPFSSTESKMDDHKRRKLQRTKLLLFHSLLDSATPSSIWHQAPPC